MVGARLGVASALLAAALVVPAAARADSVVFVRGGNVALTGEQGTLQLTSDGGYESPSMADDGTIVAVRRTADAGGRQVRHVYRMDRSGRLLNRPTVAVPVDNSNYTGPLSAQVSPDGRLVAFHYFNRRDPSRPELPRVAIAPSDRDLTDLGEVFAAGYYLNPTWIGSRTIVLFGTPGFIPNVQTYTLGSGGIADWFEPPDGGHLGSGEVSRDGTRLVATAEGGAELRLYSLPGPPPAAPQPTCRFAGAPGTFQRPRWSPDGDGVVWAQPDGLHIAKVPRIDDCAAIVEQLVAPGGSDPDWGPADLPLMTAPVLQRYRLAVAVRVGCAKACRIDARLVQAGRTISRRTRRLTRAGSARLVLPKKGRRGRATVFVRVDGRARRLPVRL